MNIRIKDCCVWIDGNIACDALPSIFSDKGMDIPVKQPVPYTGFSTPTTDDPWVGPTGQVATMRDVTRQIWKLLEDLEKRFESVGQYLPSAVFRTEKEQWK